MPVIRRKFRSGPGWFFTDSISTVILNDTGEVIRSVEYVRKDEE